MMGCDFSSMYFSYVLGLVIDNRMLFGFQRILVLPSWFDYAFPILDFTFLTMVSSRQSDQSVSRTNVFRNQLHQSFKQLIFSYTWIHFGCFRSLTSVCYTFLYFGCHHCFCSLSSVQCCILFLHWLFFGNLFKKRHLMQTDFHFY